MQKSWFAALTIGAVVAGGCATSDELDPVEDPAARTVERAITIPGPPGLAYPAALALTIDGDAADGTLGFEGETFALAYRDGRLAVSDLASGASLVVAPGPAAWTFTIGGRREEFADRAALAALDLASHEQHVKLLLASQVMDEVAAEVRGGGASHRESLIGLGDLLTICFGTELTCNGQVQVWCPPHGYVTDPCGCGESVCNTCWPSTCADECENTPVCPPVEPGRPHLHEGGVEASPL